MTPRRQLYASQEVTGWSAREPDDLLTDEFCKPKVTLYPFESDRISDGGSISIQWNISVEHARDLAKNILAACDAIDAEAGK